jgi:hypothetical protein
MCNTGAIMPRTGYLDGLRELCTKHGALLIFDEVITGFRVALGGAQEYTGVTPDLATFAKGMSGGLPASAIAGKREYMQAFGDMSITHAGTYNSNAPWWPPRSSCVDMLFADGGRCKAAIQRGEQLMAGIEQAGRRAGSGSRPRHRFSRLLQRDGRVVITAPSDPRRGAYGGSGLPCTSASGPSRRVVVYPDCTPCADIGKNFGGGGRAMKAVEK